MAEQEKELTLNDMLFFALVRDFESMAMVGFGKLVDPVSQGAERNLERAKVAIDMLGMLEEKTKGNLTDMEVSLLKQVLTNLRLNYVDELEKEKAEEAKKTAEEREEAASEEKTDTAAQEGAEASGSAAERKEEAAETTGRGAGGESKAKSSAKKTRRKRKAGGGKGRGDR